MMHLIYSIIAFTCLAAGSSNHTNSSNNTNSPTYSQIALKKWTGLNCSHQIVVSLLYMTSNRSLGTGYSIKYDDISFKYLASAPNRTYSSFKISRPLRGREQLDFSHGPDREQCQLLLRSYWPRNSPSKGV